MEIVLGALHFAGPGGVQTYLLTVAQHLERLGHGVWLWAEHQGEMADLARSRGLRVAAAEGELPAAADAVLAQDGVTALTLAARYPGARRALVVHSSDYDVSLPAQVPGAAQVAVVMNEPAAARVRACALPLELVRLRQPIDTVHFRPIGVRRPRAQCVLLLGNYLEGPHRDALVERCRAAGISVEQVGRHGQARLDPRPAIAAADVVVGQGRSILEAMACGRAACVYGPGGGDGWVTADSYPALEADGFRGRATGLLSGPSELVATLAGYDPEMAEVGRALAVRHHRAIDHAVELAALLVRLEPAPPPPVAAELARAKRSEYTATAELLEVQRGLRLAQAHIDQLEAARAGWQQRAEQAEARLEAFRATRRYRLAIRIARPLDRVRTWTRSCPPVLRLLGARRRRSGRQRA